MAGSSLQAVEIDTSPDVCVALASQADGRPGRIHAAWPAVLELCRLSATDYLTAMRDFELRDGDLGLPAQELAELRQSRQTRSRKERFLARPFGAVVIGRSILPTQLPRKECAHVSPIDGRGEDARQEMGIVLIFQDGDNLLGLTIGLHLVAIVNLSDPRRQRSCR